MVSHVTHELGVLGMGVPRRAWAKLWAALDKLGEICADVAYFWMAQVGRKIFANTNFTKLVKKSPKYGVGQSSLAWPGLDGGAGLNRLFVFLGGPYNSPPLPSLPLTRSPLSVVQSRTAFPSSAVPWGYNQTRGDLSPITQGNRANLRLFSKISHLPALVTLACNAYCRVSYNF